MVHQISDISWSEKSSIDQQVLLVLNQYHCFKEGQKEQICLVIDEMHAYRFATTKTIKSLGCLTLNKWACPVSLSCKLFSINDILWPTRASLLVNCGP